MAVKSQGLCKADGPEESTTFPGWDTEPSRTNPRDGADQSHPSWEQGFWVEKAPNREFVIQPKRGISRVPHSTTWVLPKGGLVLLPRGNSREKSGDGLKMFLINIKRCNCQLGDFGSC